MFSVTPTATLSDGRPSPPKLPGQRPCVDTELGSNIGKRKPFGVALGGLSDQEIGHFPGDAASRHASAIEVGDDRDPVGAVPPRELIDRRPLLIVVHKLINDTSRQPSLHRV